ncbi:MAG TPA: GH25 family lysozyme, partial [Verrucomicrobiae bacterium]|nr:GH25 family lysozyme [Verrucomicrobiae bacterium]
MIPFETLAQRPLGIDVFDGDGTVTWSNVQASGIQFAWTKCSEGAAATNSSYSYNMTNARAAGIYIGAYHRARYDIDFGTNGADLEAAYFWTNAKTYVQGGFGYLMPMLDL